MEEPVLVRGTSTRRQPTGDPVNPAERLIDRLDPRLSVRLRLLKKRYRGDATLRVLSQLVGQGEVVVDIGANRGVYSLELSRLVGQTGRVHSFDPFPVNIRSLDRLSRSHNNITVHPIALSDCHGEAELYVPVKAGQRLDALATLVAPPVIEHDTLRVDVGVLDEILAGEQSRPTFIKCDVEGHEAQVLRGAQKIVRDHLPALLVEIEQRHRSDDIQSTFDQLVQWGYVGYVVTPKGLSLLATFDVARDQLRFLNKSFFTGSMPTGYIGNFLFVGPETEVGPLLN